MQGRLPRPHRAVSVASLSQSSHQAPQPDPAPSVLLRDFHTLLPSSRTPALPRLSSGSAADLLPVSHSKQAMGREQPLLLAAHPHRCPRSPPSPSFGLLLPSSSSRSEWSCRLINVLLLPLPLTQNIQGCSSWPPQGSARLCFPTLTLMQNHMPRHPLSASLCLPLTCSFYPPPPAPTTVHQHHHPVGVRLPRAECRQSCCIRGKVRAPKPVLSGGTAVSH